MKIITGHNGEQGPNSAHEQGKDERTHEGGLQHGSVAHVANTCAYRTADPLRRQCALEMRIALPTIQNQDHAHKGKGIEQKHRCGAGGGTGVKRNGQPAQGRAQRAGKIKARAVERDGVGELCPGDHLGHDGLPGGAVHRRADIQQESEDQQDPGRNDVKEREHAQDRDRRQHPCLPENEQTAAIEDIGRGPGQQAQDDHRQAGRGLHQGDQQGRGGEHGHQPGAGRILHPSAQVGHNGGEPQIAEEGHAQGLKAV